MDELRQTVSQAATALLQPPLYDRRVVELAAKFDSKTQYEEFAGEWEFYSGDEVKKFWDFVMDFAASTCVRICYDTVRTTLRRLTQSKGGKPKASSEIQEVLNKFTGTVTFKSLRNRLDEIRNFLLKKQSMFSNDNTSRLQEANSIFPQPIDLKKIDGTPLEKLLTDRSYLLQFVTEFWKAPDEEFPPPLRYLWLNNTAEMITRTIRQYYLLLNSLEKGTYLSIEIDIGAINKDETFRPVVFQPPQLAAAVAALDPDKWEDKGSTLLTILSGAVGLCSIFLTVSAVSTVAVLLDNEDRKLKLRLVIAAALLIAARGFDNCDNLQQLLEPRQRKSESDSVAQWIEKLLKQL